ncbi:MAG: disulfide bond formation protein B [Parvularculaceae bacterium]
MNLRRFSFADRSLGVSAVASAALLAGAHAFEAAGYAPCELCLDQREPHWVAVALATAGLGVSIVARAPRAAAAALGAVALVYAVSAGLAFYHTGVEWGFWPGPSTCGGPAPDAVASADLTAALAAGPSGPSCSDAAWRLFGVSMAGYNMLASLGLFVVCLVAALAVARDAEMAAGAVA